MLTTRLGWLWGVRQVSGIKLWVVRRPEQHVDIVVEAWQCHAAGRVLEIADDTGEDPGRICGGHLARSGKLISIGCHDRESLAAQATQHAADCRHGTARDPYGGSEADVSVEFVGIHAQNGRQPH